MDTSLSGALRTCALRCPAFPSVYWIRNWFYPDITIEAFKAAGSRAVACGSQIKWHTWILLETFWNLSDDQYFQSKVEDERDKLPREAGGIPLSDCCVSSIADTKSP